MTRKTAMIMTPTRTRRLKRGTKCGLSPRRRVMTAGRKDAAGPSASRQQRSAGRRATRRRMWQRDPLVALCLPGT